MFPESGRGEYRKDGPLSTRPAGRGGDHREARTLNDGLLVRVAARPVVSLGDASGLGDLDSDREVLDLAAQLRGELMRGEQAGLARPVPQGVVERPADAQVGEHLIPRPLPLHAQRVDPPSELYRVDPSIAHGTSVWTFEDSCGKSHGLIAMVSRTGSRFSRDETRELKAARPQSGELYSRT